MLSKWAGRLSNPRRVQTRRSSRPSFSAPLQDTLRADGLRTLRAYRFLGTAVEDERRGRGQRRVSPHPKVEPGHIYHNTDLLTLVNIG